MGLILAGGRSSRMGQDKALLTYNNQTLLSHMHHLLQQLPLADCFISRAPINCSPVKSSQESLFEAINPIEEKSLIKGKKPIDANYVADLVENKGPLGGIYSALDYVLSHQSLSDSYLLIVPVDMPLLNSQVFECLVKTANEFKKADCILFENYSLPLLLKASQTSFEVLKSMIVNSDKTFSDTSQKSKGLSIKSLLKQLTTQPIKFNHEIADWHDYFVNVNTPEEWQSLNKPVNQE